MAEVIVVVDAQLLDAAQEVGEQAGRSSAEQLDHWIRLGREFEQRVVTDASAPSPPPPPPSQPPSDS